MASKEATIRTRKFKLNPLLKRRQMVPRLASESSAYLILPFVSFSFN